jgi:uncharacterized repeat protein (TIGR03803 family)
MKKVLRFPVAVSAVFLLCAMTASVAPAQTFTTLVNFDGTNGANPLDGALVQGFDGDFYGTTYSGGANNSACVSSGCGTVFKITSAGMLTKLYSFCFQTNCTDGSAPYAGLVLDTNGNFYGTTPFGGANILGTVFRITSGGTLTTVYTFCSQKDCTDGALPVAGLVLGTNGNFYGATEEGGANDDCSENSGCGTVFKINPTGGTLTTLYSFCSQTNCTDGIYPVAALIQATDGNFYGTTPESGANILGTVFEITPGGTMTTLYSFCSQTNCTDGAYPEAALIQAADGNFYGTTQQGGANDDCSGGCGTVFRITPRGQLTTLHSFDYTDGAAPSAVLIQATDGNFYSTTPTGGANSYYGTVFKVTPQGELTTLHSFDGADGFQPTGALVQATNGVFYGTANGGGTQGKGTIFSLSLGLHPFVETLPTVGPVGSKVTIMGDRMTGATSVSFNGTLATFTIVSPTEIKTYVPTGATSGKVQVTTPSGTLTSNVVFRVK